MIFTVYGKFYPCSYRSVHLQTSITRSFLFSKIFSFSKNLKKDLKSTASRLEGGSFNAGYGDGLCFEDMLEFETTSQCNIY